VEKRVIRSRTGHEILLDDGPKPGITIIDSKKNKIHLDTSTNNLTAEVQGDITLKSKTGSITLDAAMGLTAKAGTNLSVSANGNANFESLGQATLNGTAGVRVASAAQASLSAPMVSLG
jgi:hypothetical protein